MHASHSRQTDLHVFLFQFGSENSRPAIGSTWRSTGSCLVVCCMRWTAGRWVSVAVAFGFRWFWILKQFLCQPSKSFDLCWMLRDSGGWSNFCVSIPNDLICAGCFGIAGGDIWEYMIGYMEARLASGGRHGVACMLSWWFPQQAWTSVCFSGILLTLRSWMQTSVMLLLSL